MDLRRRLERLDRAVGVPAAQDEGAGAAREERLVALGLSRRDGVAGPVWSRTGCASLLPPQARPADLAPLATRPLPEDLAWDDLLFLDTETTGLAGGTGTLPFLVGLAWWRGGVLQWRLDFLPSPAGESALLADLAATASRFRAVATYNGNGFDLPLLRTRGILARRRDLLADLLSLDLLPVCRRLWARRLPDVRQGTVERIVAGVTREGEDIPGAQIPKAWTDFVQGGETGAVRRVLEHNRWDLEGMAAILVRVAEAARILEDGAANAPGDLPWRDAWSLARLCERRREHPASWGWIRLALAGAPVGTFQREHGLGPPEAFFQDAVRLIKRTGEWRELAALLDLARPHVRGAPWWQREAAILYEHRLPDLPRALRHALRAEDPHRVARLRRRLAGADPDVAADRPMA